MSIPLDSSKSKSKSCAVSEASSRFRSFSDGPHPGSPTAAKPFGPEDFLLARRSPAATEPVKVRSTVFWGERTECKDDLAKIRQGGGEQVWNSEAAKDAFMI